jgi:DNA-directed RNA polymerase specialized sigma24 family protein
MKVNQKILDEASPIIERLAKSRSANGSFAYYEGGDVYQEIWCMCLEALSRYDPTIGPIENYLVRHVTNRLKNLKRDKYFRPGSDMPTSGLARTRMNLVNALPLNSDDISDQGMLLCSASSNVEPIQYILRDETLIYIRQRLPESLSEPFEELIGNNKVRSPLVEEVRQKVAEILSERDDDVGG